MVELGEQDDLKLLCNGVKLYHVNFVSGDRLCTT